MKAILTSISLLLMLNLSCLAQKRISRDSLDSYLNEVNNSSVIITHNYFESLHLDPLAIKICENLDEYSIERLANFLSVEEKVLVSHIILSKAFDPKNVDLKYKYEYKNEKIDTVIYTYNNFSWILLRNGSLKMDSIEMKKIQEYWSTKKLSEKRTKNGCISKLSR